MIFAGYNLRNITRTIIVSAGAEVGLKTSFIMSVIHHGNVGLQLIAPMDGPMYGDAVRRLNMIYPDYHWQSRLSLSKLNHYTTVFARNNCNTLYPLV